MGRRSTRYATQKEFDLAVEFMHLPSDKHKEAAQLLVVHREEQSIVGKKFGWTRGYAQKLQRDAFDAIELMRKTLEGGVVKEVTLPQGWVRETFIGPKEIIESLKDQLKNTIV